MAKDPAFLFYPGDFSTGTQFFTDEQVGKYIRLLMAQHNHGRLTKAQFMFICKTIDNEILAKFNVDENSLYYNERLENESAKRKSYSASRKNNRNKLNNDSLHIYFIKNPVDGLIKIGSSVDVERRFLELKRQYNDSLELLFISEKYPQSKEKELHSIFKNKNKFNEWFELNNNDLNEIRTTHIKVHMINHMENRNRNKDIVTVLDIEKEFLNSPLWVEDVCRNYNFSKQFVEFEMKKFVAEQKLKTDIEKRTIEDLRKHFINIIKKIKPEEIKTNDFFKKRKITNA